MNDWVDSPVLVLRRWHGVERVREVRTAICSLVYMNDEYQKGALRERREEEGWGDTFCRFYTVADNIMNPFYDPLFFTLPMLQLRNWIE